MASVGSTTLAHRPYLSGGSDGPGLKDTPRLRQLISDYNVYNGGRLGEVTVKCRRDETVELRGVLRIYWDVSRPLLLAAESRSMVTPRPAEEPRRRRSRVLKTRSDIQVGESHADLRSKTDKPSEQAPANSGGGGTSRRSFVARGAEKLFSRRRSSNLLKADAMRDPSTGNLRSHSAEPQGSYKERKMSNDLSTSSASVARPRAKSVVFARDKSGEGEEAMAESFMPPSGSVTNIRVDSSQTTTEVSVIKIPAEITAIFVCNSISY